MLVDKLADQITKKQNRAYDLDVLRQSLTLAFLKKHLNKQLVSDRPTACVIGDGFASMTSLLLAGRLVNTVILLNLTKTLLVDLWYLQLWMGPDRFSSSIDLVTDEDGMRLSLEKPVSDKPGEIRVIAIQAAHHSLLRLSPIDLAINIASMQEMNPSIVDAYFDDLRAISEHHRLIFYCCNREEKTLPDSIVTRFSDYPWHESDQVIVDELCPWHQQYYTARPPFYRPYDGPIRHRLAIFDN